MGRSLAPLQRPCGARLSFPEDHEHRGAAARDQNRQGDNPSQAKYGDKWGAEYGEKGKYYKKPSQCSNHSDAEEPLGRVPHESGCY
ncbi:MAG TPA: hypothetical protein VN939_18475, partial [Chthoniobacterales bacterium]|nr:hypothetical protein [Chthoniobacterales bacterium]